MKNNKMDEAQRVVLLIEDNLYHSYLIMRSLQNNRVPSEIYHVPDGEAALDYVLRRGKYADREKTPWLCLILLDLRLPKIDGLEVLREIKGANELRHVPVVILTTSEAQTDMVRAYDYHTNSYLVKPVDFEKFNQMVDDLCYYWLAWNRNPGSTQPTKKRT
jgi:CheY-like chemotaxis protein